MIAVSTLLVASFMAYSDALRTSSETRQLRNLINKVASKSTELLSLTLTTNASADTFVQMPPTIGNEQYWLRLCNDSANLWLIGGLGGFPEERAGLRVYLPKEAVASGCYIGGYGAAHLRCAIDAGYPELLLTNSSTGV